MTSKAQEAGQQYVPGPNQPVGVQYTPGPNMQQPGAVQYMGQPPMAANPQPSDYLCLSIFNLLCCFWPLGIVALIKSLEVRSHYDAGRYRQSMASSRMAKLMNQIGFAVGSIVLCISVVLTLFIVGVGVAVPIALIVNNATGAFTASPTTAM